MNELDKTQLPYEGLSGPEIERKSFEIIESEMGETHFSSEELSIAMRVIHATADFDFLKNLTFHPSSVERGKSSIKAGRAILTDVNMVASGVNKFLCESFGVQVITPIGSWECSNLASERRITRAAAAMELGSKQGDVGIVAIGNAPTALVHALDLIFSGALKPDLIVGVPVGFVNAEEAKEMLANQNLVPYITARGRKGGSPVAAAILNALLKLSADNPSHDGN